MSTSSSCHDECSCVFGKVSLQTYISPFVTCYTLGLGPHVCILQHPLLHHCFCMFPGLESIRNLSLLTTPVCYRQGSLPHAPHSCFITSSTARCPSEAASAAATSALAACNALATPRATSAVLCWSNQRLNWAGVSPERSAGVWMLSGNLQLNTTQQNTADHRTAQHSNIRHRKAQRGTVTCRGSAC